MMKNAEAIVITTLSILLFLIIAVLGVEIVKLQKEVSDLRARQDFLETRLAVEEGIYYVP